MKDQQVGPGATSQRQLEQQYQYEQVVQQIDFRETKLS